MPNQAIALQARAPQSSGLGGAIQQNAMLINQMMQQQAAQRQEQAAQRQAQQAQQAMTIQAAQESRAAAAAQIETARKRLDFHRDLASQVRSKAGYENWLQGVEQDSPQIAASFRLNLPPDEFRPDLLMQMVGTAEQNFNARFPKAISTAGQTPEGGYMSVTTSSIPGASFAAPVPDISRPIAGAPPPPAATAAAPAAADLLAKMPADLRNIITIAKQTGTITPDNVRKLGRAVGEPGVRELQNFILDNNIRMTDETPPAAGVQPMSYAPGAVMGSQQPDLANMVQTMMQTGVVSQSNLDAMRQAAGPGKDAQLAQILQAHNIRIMPDEGMPGGLRSAIYRPEEGAPAMQEVQYDPRAYQQAQGKPPMQSPMPGSAIVPLPRVRGQAAAEEGGKQGVRVATEPQIAAGTKSAEYKVQLQQNLPKARGALNLATSQLDRDIADIDFVLRTPEREMVVGNVEGRLPSVVNIFRSGGQQAQNVQDRLDKINASSVVKHLQQMRESSPQGSSLFGQVTEYEDRLVSALAGLKQTQDEATFDKALRDYRNVLVEMRQNLPQVFNDTFAPIGEKAVISPARPAPGNTPTRSDIDYLKRNQNNPNVVNGFRQHFGEDAYRQAVGR